MKLSNRRLQRHRKIQLSMTSMIDVVFLLLIFFLTTASFVPTERDLESTMRVQSTSAGASDLQPAVVDVVPGRSGFVYRLGQRELDDPEQLTDLLARFDNKAQGAFVRVSDRAPFRMAAAAVQACKTAGFASVSYIPLGDEP
ncbi:MAG: biopolymer transporter ExbD [Planctomycetaceae bacterium]|nr:MAG: biopolymer transporter ExbD [Planctomycetaceae bacterium]